MDRTTFESYAVEYYATSVRLCRVMQRLEDAEDLAQRVWCRLTEVFHAGDLDGIETEEEFRFRLVAECCRQPARSHRYATAQCRDERRTSGFDGSEAMESLEFSDAAQWPEKPVDDGDYVDFIRRQAASILGEEADKVIDGLMAASCKAEAARLIGWTRPRIGRIVTKIRQACVTGE